MRKMPPRPLLRLCIAVLFLLALAPATAKSAPWQAVLVAGDKAQPVFDNALDMVTRWLAHWGVPMPDIHRLSATPRSGDPSVEPATAQRILQRVSSLRPGS